MSGVNLVFNPSTVHQELFTCTGCRTEPVVLFIVSDDRLLVPCSSPSAAYLLCHLREFPIAYSRCTEVLLQL